MLIALAASIGLVSARLWGGRGGALAAVAFFVAVRGFVSLMVGGVWDETTPHFPLYLAEALIVEAVGALLLTRRPLAFGAVAGVLIGTVGTAAEWGWSHVWMPMPWPSALLPEVRRRDRARRPSAAACIGTFIGGALRVRPRAFPRGARVVFPLRRAARRRADRLRPRHLAAGGRQGARAAAGRAAAAARAPSTPP